MLFGDFAERSIGRFRQSTCKKCEGRTFLHEYLCGEPPKSTAQHLRAGQACNGSDPVESRAITFREVYRGIRNARCD